VVYYSGVYCSLDVPLGHDGVQGLVRLPRLLIAGVVALVGWMHYWANEHVAAADDLVLYQSWIADEFKPIPYLSDLTAEQNAQLAADWEVTRTKSAELGRHSLKRAYAREDQSEFMLTTISAWATAGLCIAVIAHLLRGYRNRLHRHGEAA